jgi:hypothetical protein
MNNLVYAERGSSDGYTNVPQFRRWRHNHVRILNVMAIVTLLMGCGTANADESQDSVPTDTELHSVYCIPVVQARIRNEQRILALLSDPHGNQVSQSKKKYVIDQTQTQLEHMKSVLSRLQAYVTPVLDHRDPVPLIAAKRRADADLSQLEKQSDQCTDICSPPGENRTTDQIHQCAKSCGDQGLLSRIAECEAPTWLPP